MSGVIGMVYARRRGRLLATRQLTCYHVGDDGDMRKGLAASYTVLTDGQYSGTTPIDVPHYAAATISFATAGSVISDSANGLATFLTGDTIRVRGSVANDGVYTVTAGGTAGSLTVGSPLTSGSVGPYITICKRATPSNNCVLDNVTGLTWKRKPTNNSLANEKVGEASDGLLIFYDAIKSYTLHAAGADLQMTTSGIKIIGGSAGSPAYFVGACIVCSGFANAVNNLPGYRITAVTVNGSDLDISLWTGNQTLIAEAAAGSRAIKIVCRSVFAYCAAANAASFGGYSDWRIPNLPEFVSLSDYEQPDAMPNSTAFPYWANTYWWTTTIRPSNTTQNLYFSTSDGNSSNSPRTSAWSCALVRG